MQKTKLQKKKDNPKSKYWRTRADKLWGKAIHHLYPTCAVGEGCSGHVEAHHLISRANTATRHSIENGVGLCTLHHKYCTKLSAHSAPLAFTEWLMERFPDRWEWCCQNKQIVAKADYRAAYERLTKWLKDAV